MNRRYRYWRAGRKDDGNFSSLFSYSWLKVSKEPDGGEKEKYQPVSKPGLYVPLRLRMPCGSVSLYPPIPFASCLNPTAPLRPRLSHKKDLFGLGPGPYTSRSLDRTSEPERIASTGPSPLGINDCVSAQTSPSCLLSRKCLFLASPVP